MSLSVPETDFVLISTNGTVPIPLAKQDLFLDLYRAMLTAREVDLLEDAIVKRGDAFFHVSGAGHEAIAALNPHLTANDWLHCHYRDKALMIARGVPPEMFFDSLYATDASHSHGRQMSAHMSDPSRRILSLVGPVGNNALQAVGIAWEVKDQKSRPIVLCALGDGTTQEGEVLEAIAEAVRWELPVLFLVEDNQFSISTRTREKTFFSLPDNQEPASFYGLPIHRVSGRDTVACYDVMGKVVAAIRSRRSPALMVLTVERLTNHTNADDQSIYRSQAEIERVCHDHDPIVMLATALIDAGVSHETMAAMAADVKTSVGRAADRARGHAEPQPVFDAKKPLSAHSRDANAEYRGHDSGPRLTMLQAMNEVLRLRLSEDKRITLYGEDIEDPKGDVFGLTRGLSAAFPRQVKNSPLSESTIVGVCIGRALAGGRPIAFLQFADFLPLAFNQIVSELGSMYWRTGGGWQCPVIVMITCGGYRPGLGPFHAQTLESVAVHTPGVDVFMPATAGDAAGLLNAAVDSGRPSLFFYPKSCLNERAAATSTDISRQFVPIGRARRIHNGHDLTFVAWGNTVQRCLQAAEALAAAGVQSTVIDLRSLSPWDESMVLESVRRTHRLLVAHEDNRSCGLGAEIIATVTEKVGVPFQAVRVTRADTYVPFHFGNQLEVLPSFQRILSAAAELCDFDVDWRRPPGVEPGTFVVTATGTSPSDESVSICQWYVEVGQAVAVGEKLADIEADKASGEVHAPVAGTVQAILAAEGATVSVGTAIMRLNVPEEARSHRKPVTREEPGTPIFTRRKAAVSSASVAVGREVSPQLRAVGIAGIAGALGSRVVTNEELLHRFPGKTAAHVLRSTGINSRRRAAADEDVLSLAMQACRAVLDANRIGISDLDLVLCSTATPLAITPSLACRILHELGGDSVECPAHDLLAACSGYLYGLCAAYDHLQSCPYDKILLVTSELLSPLLNPDDFNTAIIFGDAATATLVYGEGAFANCRLRIHRPVLSGRGDGGQYLRVPLGNSDEDRFIFMNGSKVFSEGVRRMTQILAQACAECDLSPQELDRIIPHQANQRILDAISRRLRLPAGRVYSNIRDLGNTSSSSIPLCLVDLLPAAEAGQRWGLTAFGGGLTYAGGIVDVL